MIADQEILVVAQTNLRNEIGQTQTNVLIMKKSRSASDLKTRSSSKPIKMNKLQMEESSELADAFETLETAPSLRRSPMKKSQSDNQLRNLPNAPDRSEYLQ